ncbi:MAG: ParB/RepB/Spo0J family partition protein [Treponema sp.]|nr:ParB/RepB/Spo0J family partition protein [Treponema sp.]
MPKMETAGKIRQISLTQIVENDNVRKEYNGIEELAASIKINGLIEPIAVKAIGKDNDGIDKYELVAGFRRRRAFQHLCDMGENYSMIDITIVTGDKLTLQLVENLQRADLTHVEMESGIHQLAQSLGSNKEAAARLGKSDYFIARNITAHRTREALKDLGVNTASLSTTALNEIQSLSGENLKAAGIKLVTEGGTAAVARQLAREHNEPHISQEEPGQTEAGNVQAAESDSDNSFASAMPDDDVTDAPVLLPASPEKKPEKKKQAQKLEPPPHKNVSLNSVQVVIQRYIDGINSSSAKSEYADAAYEIWALLLSELGGK